MHENLNHGEVIAIVPKEEVAIIKEIAAEKEAIKHIINIAIERNRSAIIKERSFWDKMRKDYFIDPSTNFYIDFATGELRKG